MRRTEKWKWIRGYKGYYKVSNLGRVKSIKHTWINGAGHRCTTSPRILKTSGWHYPIVGLRKKGKRKTFCVHDLVLTTFAGKCPDGLECCHRNDVRSDNKLTNLYWGTHSQNLQDAVRNGNKKVGSKLSFAKLNEELVIWIVLLVQKGASQAALARAFNVSQTVIWEVCNGRTWRHATCGILGLS